ncbi:MAG: hypothetical protein D6675_06825, partial [Gemmatimonadetes bacterium]
KWVPHQDFYCEVLEFKDRSYYIGFKYDAQDLDRAGFLREYANRPIAISGLRVCAFREINKQYSFESVDVDLVDMFAQKYVTCLILDFHHRAQFQYCLNLFDVYPTRLFVDLKGKTREPFLLVIGTPAFLVHAELREKWESNRQTTQHPNP